MKKRQFVPFEGSAQLHGAAEHPEVKRLLGAITRGAATAAAAPYETDKSSIMLLCTAPSALLVPRPGGEQPLLAIGLDTAFARDFAKQIVDACDEADKHSGRTPS